jgi:hypothetical protein
VPVLRSDTKEPKNPHAQVPGLDRQLLPAPARRVERLLEEGGFPLVDRRRPLDRVRHRGRHLELLPREEGRRSA